MKKKLLPGLVLTMLGLSSSAATYMIVKQADGSTVEYDVENVVEVTYRKDSTQTGEQICKCECDLPQLDSWEMVDGTTGEIKGGSLILLRGSNLTQITSISFGGVEAEISPAFVTDNTLVLKFPEGVAKNVSTHITTEKCAEGFDSDVLGLILPPPCVSMCDNEMAVKTLRVIGSNLYAPLKAKFWDGTAHTIVASTEDGSISIDDGNHAIITIPEGVADNGTIVFEGEGGESETEFIFRDTRNLLITHDDPELNIFNSDKPDEYRVDEETGDTIGLPIPKETLKSTIFASDNTRGDFSIFFDIDGYTAWTYSPTGESNPDGIAPKYPTPFGCFSESIDKGETSFNDYVIKFEVFVPKEYPINGNGLAISFYNNVWQDIREYCAFWQPSRTTFDKDLDGVWLKRATFENWTTGGDWLTITIPMEELRFNFATKDYYCAAQNDRIISDEPGHEYDGYGDKENGLPFFEKYGSKYAAYLQDAPKVKAIQSIGIEFGNADQGNWKNNPLIAVDNLRIVPKNNNGGYYPFLRYGYPERDFYQYPVFRCK